MVNIVDGGRVNLTAEQFVAPSLHPSDHIGVSVIHVNLDIPRWCFAALVVDNIERDICCTPIVFVSYWRRLVWHLYGWGLKTRSPGSVERRRLEHLDFDDGDWTCSSPLITSPPSSTTSSS